MSTDNHTPAKRLINPAIMQLRPFLKDKKFGLDELLNMIQDVAEKYWPKMRDEKNVLAERVKTLEAENEIREEKLKEMFRLTGLHPKVEDWTNKIQEQELIIYGLEEGSAQWEEKARDAESLNAELVEALKVLANAKSTPRKVASEVQHILSNAALSRAEGGKTVMSHKFKRLNGFEFIVVAKCLHCGLKRMGTKNNYVYIVNDKDQSEMPPCGGRTQN